MNKVTIADGPGRPQAFPERHNLTCSDVSSRPVITTDVAPLGLWRHEMAPGASIRLKNAPEDHLFYVEMGELRVGAEAAGPEWVVSIGQSASATLQAGAAGAVLLHYIGDAANRPDKPGGCVHVVSDAGIISSKGTRPGLSKTLYLDATCPRCSVWLHGVQMLPGSSVPPHCHTENEVIAITGGQLVLGSRELVTGAAVAVCEGAYYSFTAGEDGLTFLNFRQDDPYAMLKGAKPRVFMSERELFYAAHRETTGEPVIQA